MLSLRILVLAAVVTVAVLAVTAALVLTRDRPPPVRAAGEVREVHLRCDADTCRFVPDRLVIVLGTTVRWVNDGDVYHTVTSSTPASPVRPSGRFDRALAARGETFEHSFNAPGVQAFFCQPHSDTMRGVIEVRP